MRLRTNDARWLRSLAEDEDMCDLVPSEQTRLRNIADKIERLEAALRFYASEATYRDKHPELEETAIELDYGNMARAALTSLDTPDHT